MNTKYGACPICGKGWLVIKANKLPPHKDPATGDQCDQREPNA